MRRLSKRIGGGLAFAAVPTAVIAGIWLPVFRHYHVPTPDIAREALEAARLQPADSILDQLSKMDLGIDPSGGNESMTLMVADSILEGTVLTPTRSWTISLPFSSEDVDAGPSFQKIFMSGLGGPRMLIRAYRQTGEDFYLEAARDIILAWASFERSRLLPKGMLWHDHVLAERVLVISEFWEVYRNHPIYDPAEAKSILQFATRSARFLAKDSHFNAGHNHGLMQNLALWHYAAAFPTLPDASRFRQLALDRTDGLMDSYVTDQGVVTEHSAGYQEWALGLLAMAFKYSRLLQMPVPCEWLGKYQRAEVFYRQLLRPDGTLPMFGDTQSRAHLTADRDDETSVAAACGMLSLPLEDMTVTAETFDPLAGYLIWWQGLAKGPPQEHLAQTVVAWPNLPGDGKRGRHKHADETSVILWARGENWWTNTGYWPYGVTGRSFAESWNGSNAPHLEGEPFGIDRTTTVRSYGWSELLALADLYRSTSRHTVRRQVIQLRGEVWIVVDQVTGAPGAYSETLWTTWPDVEMEAGQFPQSYVLTSVRSNARLLAFYLGQPGLEVEPIRGSRDPFGGWVVNEGIPVTAPAVRVRQPASESWVATVWLLDGEGNRTTVGPPSMTRWESADEWDLSIPLSEAPLSISRHNNTLSAAGAGGSPLRLALYSPEPVTEEVESLRKAYYHHKSDYPDFNDRLGYRRAITFFLVGLLLLQELGFFLFRRFTKQTDHLLRTGFTLAWVLGGIWLFLYRL